MSLKKNVVANYFGQGWAGLMSLAFIPIYIQYIGIEAYGLIGLFAVIQVWLTLFDMGITPALSREMARFTAGAHTPQSIRDLLRSLEWIVFTLTVLIALSLWAGSNWLASNWLRAENLSVQTVSEALAITSLVIALRFCEGLYRSAIIGLQQQTWYNIANVILATLRHGGAVLILIFISPTIQAFFIWQAVISLLVLVTYAAKLYRLLPEASQRVLFSVAAIKSVWRFAGGAVGINLLAILLTQMDKVLLSRLLSLEHFGYYTLAGVVAGGLYMMVGPITQAIYPRMVELHTSDNPQALARVYHQGAQLVSVLTGPVMVLLFFFSYGFIYAWSGNADLAGNTAPILAPLVLGTFINILVWMPYQCQLAHGWTSLTLKTNIVAVIILVPAILWLVPLYGAVGAAWLWVVLNSGYLIISAQFMYRRIMPGEKWRWYGEDILLPVAGALFGLFLLQTMQPEIGSSRMEWVIYLIISGSLVFALSGVCSSWIREWMRIMLARMVSNFQQGK